MKNPQVNPHIPFNGFIKIHRKIILWEWYRDSCVKDTFLHLLLTANYENRKWMGITIKRGQVVISYKSLADDLGFTVQQVRTAIKKLKKTGEVTSKSTNKYTVVTLVNYETYQLNDETSTSKLTNEQHAETITNILQNDYKCENATNKSTNKKNPEPLEQQGFTKTKEETSTSKLTNEQQTNNKQITNEQQQLKNIKNNKNSSMHGAIKKAPVPKEQQAAKIILNDKTYHIVTKDDVKHWEELYPNVNILQELKKMQGWSEANPNRRKTRRGVLRFINNWLAREQDRGALKPILKESEITYE